VLTTKHDQRKAIDARAQLQTSWYIFGAFSSQDFWRTRQFGMSWFALTGATGATLKSRVRGRIVLQPTITTLLSQQFEPITRR
jgi:hypothetical protein